EDGIRDFHVTGVQTCALPISVWPWQSFPASDAIETFRVTVALLCESRLIAWVGLCTSTLMQLSPPVTLAVTVSVPFSEPLLRTRSEERRVGKEWSARGMRVR